MILFHRSYIIIDVGNATRNQFQIRCVHTIFKVLKLWLVELKTDRSLKLDWKHENNYNSTSHPTVRCKVSLRSQSLSTVQTTEAAMFFNNNQSACKTNLTFNREEEFKGPKEIDLSALKVGFNPEMKVKKHLDKQINVHCIITSQWGLLALLLHVQMRAIAFRQRDS